MSDAPAATTATTTPAERAAAPGRKRGKRLEVARRLPRDVKRAVESAVCAAPALTEEVIDKIDERFALRQRFDISRPGLVRFLRKLRTFHVPSARQIADLHERQDSISGILKRTLGPFAESDPRLWEQRAFLMLMGILYSRMATNEKEIPTKELVALSKMLAENRRVEVRSRDGKADSALPETSDEGLVEELEEAVRRVYGTNLEETNGQGMSKRSEDPGAPGSNCEFGMLNEGQ